MNDRWIVMLVPWLLTHVARPLMPAHHPWKARAPSLRSWVYAGSEFAYCIGAGFLFGLIANVTLWLCLAFA